MLTLRFIALASVISLAVRAEEPGCTINGSIQGLNANSFPAIWASADLPPQELVQLFPLRGDTLFVGEMTTNRTLFKIDVPAEYCQLKPWHIVVAESESRSSDMVVGDPFAKGKTLRFKLASTPRYRVTLVDESGNPPAGTCVVVQAARWVRALSDASDFRIGDDYLYAKQIKAGVFEIVKTVPGQTIIKAMCEESAEREVYREVTIRSGQKNDLSLQIPKGVTISGVVLSAAGKPVKNHDAHPHGVGRLCEGSGFIGRSAEDGTFVSIGLRPGCEYDFVSSGADGGGMLRVKAPASNVRLQISQPRLDPFTTGH